MLSRALAASKQAASSLHHSPAFGLAAGVLGFNEDRAVRAFLHQTVASLVSACQRLLPLGQSAATRILWNLKPAIVETSSRSAVCPLDDACCFMPLLDWGAMEHPALRTRLFIS
jgi:urease accessory protein